MGRVVSSDRLGDLIISQGTGSIVLTVLVCQDLLEEFELTRG